MPASCHTPLFWMNTAPLESPTEKSHSFELAPRSNVAFRKSPNVAPLLTVVATSFSPQRSTPSLAPHCQPLVAPLTMTAGPRCVPRPNTTQCLPTSLVLV